MIARDPEERSFYQDRLKMERDVRAKIDYATEEARKIVIQEGRQVGWQEGILEERTRTVKMLRDILRAAKPSDDELAELSLDNLSNIEAGFGLVA